MEIGLHRSAQIAGVRIDFLDSSGALQEVEDAAVGHRGMGVHFVNAYTLSLADGDQHFRAVLNNADINLPDGRPVAWAGRRMVTGAAQLCGPDFMLHAFAHGKFLRHFLYGSDHSTVTRLATNLSRSFPHARIVGVQSPPFRPLTAPERRRLLERVAGVGANVMWVGLGTPKQDMFVEEMKDGLGIPLLAVGAAFDFHSGRKSRPASWVSAAGLEWAYRFAAEPRRLWRRYLFGNARFLWALCRRGVQTL